jgi:hypothetical protein
MEQMRSADEFLALVVPALVISTAIFLVLMGIYRLIHKQTRVEQLPFLAAFCLIGAMPGVIAGYSQEQIAGIFLTGIVGIVSGLLSYMFSQESLEEWRPVIPFAIIATVVCSLAGFAAGGESKKKWIDYGELVQDRRLEMEEVWAPVERERRLINLKRFAEANKDAIITRQDVVNLDREVTEEGE